MNNPQLDVIRKLLIEYDLIHAVVNPAQQQDEYDLEIPMVAGALRDCNDHKSLRRELRRIFAKTAGTFEAGTVFRYTKLSKELMKLKADTNAQCGM